MTTPGQIKFLGIIKCTDFLCSDDLLDLLSSISSISTRHVEEQTLPLLFSSLPDSAPARTAIAERSRYLRILTALSKLCIQPELFETLVIRLSTKLDLVCVATNPSLTVQDSDPEPVAAYAHSILTALANTLQTKVDLKHADIPKYIDRLISRLFNLFIYASLLPDSGNSAAKNHRVIGVAARIITLVVQTVSVQ
jgi:DNA repair/transcription protein MET18/MMS19